MAAARTPVERSHLIAGATPREAYDVVVDFEAYPRLFPEFKAVRVIATESNRRRVEFRAQVVLPVRYVLDIVCDPDAPAVDWTFVEGEVVKDVVGRWRFQAQGDGVRLDYRASMDVDAPLPGFVLRKVTDGLVSLSLPAMFAAITREVRERRARAGAR